MAWKRFNRLAGIHVSDAATSPTDPAAPSGERRQVTVLFADMLGFTAISERLGEEGTFALIQPIYELMARAVREQGGSVKDFTGDGIMALFGAPDALEDAPLRACRAGLLIFERLAVAAPAIEAKHGVRPQMRIGVNSGLAVVTQIRGESGQATALGDTVNLASRLQTLAEPGTVYLSEATHRLVQGLVDTAFAGAHPIKGKAEAQKVYRLGAIRKGATRFNAAVGRGLSAYVGRERELDVLERTFAEARRELRVIDVVADPGMGKSRLLHEFRQRIGEEQAFILTGSCSPDGQQTPFLPFIEVVRGSFQVRSGEGESEVVRKLEMGLNELGLHSPENLGLLLNLLGLKPREGALAGLDGMLIGLRTRDLLQDLLAARCRVSQVVLLIEDLHWADSLSEEVLEKIIEGATNLGVIILHTRRPEYEAPWRDKPVVTTLRLEPLPAGDIRRLVQSRLGVDALPETLARQVIEKAEGNALFAEEILSFLAERGVLRAASGEVEFDADAVGAALPASVQSLLTARVDRLAPRDRALLQAAAVIGRRFDPQLLAAAAEVGSDIDARLAAIQALDLVYPDAKSGDYAFKHALVRDALYQSLLTGPRVALHLKIAEEIERHRGNRLTEVVEILANHYSQTDRAEKAFTYLAMAGAKSLGVYSLEEAGKYFAAAIALLDKKSDCASDRQVADLLVDYTLYSNLSYRLKPLTDIVERFRSRLDRTSDGPSYVLVQHHYVLALLYSARYREAEKAQATLSAMAARLHDARSSAYALTSGIHVSTIFAPYPVEVFETLSREATTAASSINDPYLQCFARYLVGWEEIHRGRIAKAHEAAMDLMAVGRRMNDPRSIGFGMQLQCWIALVRDDYDAALKFADTAISVARTPIDQANSLSAKIITLVLLRRPGAFRRFGEWMDQCTANDWGYALAGTEGIYGVALVLHGDVSAGIRWIKQAIWRREQEGYLTLADWYRLFLCEVFLEIISGREKPPARVLARNMLTLVGVTFTAQKRICALVKQVRQNPQFDQNGHHIGRCEMILGLLFKAKKKRALAIQHLAEAKRIASQFGPSPMLAKIDVALADLA
jgi:class 3 adenylate cyclase